MALTQRKTEQKAAMTGRQFKRRSSSHSWVPGKPVTWKILLFLLSIPLTALYIGYTLGNYLMPPARKFPDKGVVVDIGKLNYSWYNSHNVTLDFVGGLGNQMFQYAALCGIAKANGMKPVITSNNRLYDVFPAMKATFVKDTKQFDGYSHFNEFNTNSFDGRTFSLNFMKNLHLDGYFQSWRYFDHMRADMRKQLTFPRELRDRVQGALRDIYKTYLDNVDPEVLQDKRFPPQFVGVHIRRGDMLEQSSIDRGYTTADPDFIRRALEYYRVTYKHVIFVVATDDETWAREYAKTDSKSSLVVLSPFSSHHHAAYDLCLLASCNHSIVTVGTFGWWGAWLAGGDVIYYRNYPKIQSSLARQFSHADYYPYNWVPL